jgi:uncharacterized protein DUF1559
MTKQRSKRAWLWETAIVLVVIGGLIAILYPAFLAARRAAWRSQHCSNLKQIGLGLHNFHDTYKRFPPAVRRDELGRPLSSWRFQILPFLEAIMVDVQFGERWDDPVNRWLMDRWNTSFCLYRNRDSADAGKTNVVAITGPGTAFEEGRICGHGDTNPNTILAVEVAAFDAYWMEPGDLHIDRIPDNLTAGPEGDGFHVLFADGSVWFLKPEAPLDDVKKFFTLKGSKQYDRDDVLGPYAL